MDTRKKALDTIISWLNDHYFTIPQESQFQLSALPHQKLLDLLEEIPNFQSHLDLISWLNLNDDRRIVSSKQSEYIEEAEGGEYWVHLGGNEPFQLPTGEIVDPDGTITTPDGFKFKAVIESGIFLGMQYFHPDGTPRQPGEVVQLPDGSQVIQEVISEC